MNFPPLPAIPPASDISRYPSSPPDFLSPITRYEADERARDLVYEIYEETPIDERVYLLTRAFQTFPFSVDAYLNWGYIYRSMMTPKQPKKAKEAYQKAVTCAKLLWPELEQQDLIEWGYIEHRPYLRAVAGLAYAHKDLGDLDEAIKGFKYLLKVNPSDNQGVRLDMFFALLDSGDYTLADQFFETQENPESDLLYGYVLIAFRKFKRDDVKEEVVQKALVSAIMTNTFVPDLLLNLKEIPNRPKSFALGNREEAVKIVNRLGKAWKSTPGLQDWYRSQVKLGGNKPKDDGTILFKMLQEGRVLVVTDTDEAGRKTMDLTTKVANIPGRALDDFHLAPGMKTHDSQRIVAFDYRHDRRASWQQKYAVFSYDKVESIPFWKIFQSYQHDLEEKKESHCTVCYEKAKLCCAACHVNWYCSKKCQVDDWKGRGDRGAGRVTHKIMCKRFQKT